MLWQGLIPHGVWNGVGHPMMLRNRVSIVFAIAVAALLVVPGTVQAEGQGGGKVSNSAPVILQVTSDDSAVNKGDSSILNCKVRDRNNVADLQYIAFELRNATGDLIFTTNHNLSASGAEDQQGPQPGTWTNGWRAWYPGGGDGVLQCRYQYNYADAGQFTWRFIAADEEGAVWDATYDVTVEVLEAIQTHADPISDSGNAQEGAPWGGWVVEANATNVEGDNWIRVDNTGVDPQQSFVIDFSDAVFTGVQDAAESVGVDGNLEFTFVELPTTETFDLSGVNKTWADANADGAATFAFTDTGNTMFVKYRLKQLPEVLKDQDYSVGFTIAL